MTRYEEEGLLDRIQALTAEATRLLRSAYGAYRRQQIEWELSQLYKSLATVVEHDKQLQVVSQMWDAVETHVADAVIRERIKKAWLRIPT